MPAPPADGRCSLAASWRVRADRDARRMVHSSVKVGWATPNGIMGRASQGTLRQPLLCFVANSSRSLVGRRVEGLAHHPQPVLGEEARRAQLHRRAREGEWHGEQKRSPVPVGVLHHGG